MIERLFLELLVGLSNVHWPGALLGIVVCLCASALAFLAMLRWL